jgi:NAD(P)-dependent dehydrogenase (short-subunit alcohol dehydrogenase family)
MKKKTNEIIKKIKNELNFEYLKYMSLDLSSLESVRKFVENYKLNKNDLPPLKGLVNNAGIQYRNGIKYTKDNIELTFGVNHLGHFLLTNLLLKYFEDDSRIIFVSSSTHDPDKKSTAPKPKYTNAKELAYLKDINENGLVRYTTSKLCNIYCVYELDKKLKEKGLNIKVNAMDPGLMIGTDIIRNNNNTFIKFIWYYILPYIIPLLKICFSGININKVSLSGNNLANFIVSNEFENISGKYFKGNEEIKSSVESYNIFKSDELWKTSLKLTELNENEIFQD